MALWQLHQQWRQGLFRTRGRSGCWGAAAARALPAPSLGEQAFPEKFGAHGGVRARCACSWVGISGRKGKSALFWSPPRAGAVFGGDGGRGAEGCWGWETRQGGLVASISCITGRTWSFLVVSNHQIWTDFQGACKKRFPHPRLLSLPNCGDCCKLLSSIKDFISA